LPDNIGEKQPNQRVSAWMKDISNFLSIKYQMGYSIHNSDVQEKQQPLQTSLPVPVNKSRHKYFTFQLLSKHMILKSIREHLELM
jgi:hypothetical protein